MLLDHDDTVFFFFFEKGDQLGNTKKKQEIPFRMRMNISLCRQKYS